MWYYVCLQKDSKVYCDVTILHCLHCFAMAVGENSDYNNLLWCQQHFLASWWRRILECDQDFGPYWVHCYLHLLTLGWSLFSICAILSGIIFVMFVDQLIYLHMYLFMRETCAFTYLRFSCIIYSIQSCCIFNAAMCISFP